MPDRPTTLQRLAARSQIEGDCLVWTGYRDKRGYGHIRIGPSSTLVHRAAWIARHGMPTPDKPHVLHHCDNPPCWKDGHLWLGTNADNVADRDAKGRQWLMAKTECIRGHPFDSVNTYLSPNGKRECRECRRARYKATGPHPRPTHCPHGHLLAGDNLYVSPKGYRSCRTCGRLVAQRRRDQLKEARRTRYLSAEEVADAS